MTDRSKPVVPAVAPPGGCERLGCCIPFCRRTFKQDKFATPWPEGMEVMCGQHARMMTADLRARKRKVRKLWRKAERLTNDTPNKGRLLSVLARWDLELWALGKRQVSERAGGIA